MAKLYDSITADLRQWIEAQHLFFVASAPLAAAGHVNLSPKGHDCLRVLDDRTVAYMDLTGSGNETAAHITENGRLTMLWCAFDGPPRILRLHGHGEIVTEDAARWDELSALFPSYTASRQIVINHVERIQTSCGFAVPLYAYQGERDTHTRWADTQGREGILAYQRDNNAHSIDGLPTPVVIRS